MHFIASEILMSLSFFCLSMCRYAPTYTPRKKKNHLCICSPDCCICTAVIGCHQTTQRTLCHTPVNDLPVQGYCTCGGKHSPPEAVVQTCTLCNLTIHASWFEGKLDNGLILLQNTINEIQDRSSIYSPGWPTSCCMFAELLLRT